MKRMLGLLALGLVAVGCRAEMRGWQQIDLPTHDRQRAFDAARSVLGRHFDLAEVNWSRGTIETRPQPFEGKPSGMLADVRGAGGRWRRTATCELDRDGLTMVARVAVRLEREQTEQVVATAPQASGDVTRDVPASLPPGAGPGARPGREVWVEVGYDEALARELLAEIAEVVRQGEAGEEMPRPEAPREALEEGRRLGAEAGY